MFQAPLLMGQQVLLMTSLKCQQVIVYHKVHLRIHFLHSYGITIIYVVSNPDPLFNLCINAKLVKLYSDAGIFIYRMVSYSWVDQWD